MLIRVDVWLWATRQLKSRSLAIIAARAEHARTNGITARVANQVKVGDEMRLRVNGFDRVLEVLELLPRRVGTPEAVKAYWDIAPPRLTDPAVGAVIFQSRGIRRPTRKECRQLDALCGHTAY